LQPALERWPTWPADDQNEIVRALEAPEGTFVIHRLISSIDFAGYFMLIRPSSLEILLVVLFDDESS